VTNGFGNIPLNIEPILKRLLDGLKETAEVGEGVRGKNPLKRYVKIEDLVDLNLARILTVSPSTGFISGRNLVGNTAGRSEVPPTPTGFAASSGFDHVFLSWTPPTKLYSNHAKTLIYRGTEDNIANAVVIAESNGFVWADFNLLQEVEYYYWIRFESIPALPGGDGIKGPYNSALGTVASRSMTPTEFLEIIKDQIERTHLSEALNAEINDIQLDVVALETVFGDTENSAQNAAAAANAAADAIEARTQAIIAQTLAEAAQLGSEVAQTASETALIATTAQATAASTSATEALAASSASQSAAIASTSERIAAEAARDLADGSAAAAVTSESNASGYATDSEAAASASQSFSVTAESARDSAIAAQNLSGDSATASAASASSAATSATEAEDSASAALISETNAGTSESNAGTSASQASTSETNAAGSASSASMAETNSSQSASDASGSATAAANSASTASTAVTDATNSAQAAEASKVSAESASSDASNKAAAASTSASQAQTEASNASSSATSAIEASTSASASESLALTYSNSASQSATDAEGFSQASAQDYTAVSARLNDFSNSGATVEQSMIASANSLGEMNSQYRVKIDGGSIAGFGLSSELVDGNYVSTFMVQANRFFVGSYAGEIETRSVTLDQDITEDGSCYVESKSNHNLTSGDEVVAVNADQEGWRDGERFEVYVQDSTHFSFDFGWQEGRVLTSSMLINGNKLLSLTRVGVVATAIFALPSSTNGLLIGQEISITNVDESEWLGRKGPILSISGTAITFTCDGTERVSPEASVRFRKITVPFAIYGGNTYINTAMIRDATIGSAKIYSLSATKITGFDAAFFYANINTLDATQITVENLTATHINGDIQRVLSFTDLDITSLNNASPVPIASSLIPASTGITGHKVGVNLTGYIEDTSTGEDRMLEISAYARISNSTAGSSHTEKGPGTVTTSLIFHFNTLSELNAVDIQIGDTVSKSGASALVTGSLIGFEDDGDPEDPQVDYYTLTCFTTNRVGTITTGGTVTVTRPNWSKLGSMLVPTSTQKTVPYAFNGVSSSRYTTNVDIEIRAQIFTTAMTPTSTSSYDNITTTGFVFGLR